VTEDEGPWVGDLVLDPVTGRKATLSNVDSSGAYVLRAYGGAEWIAEDPARLEVVTRRKDRTEWPFPGFRG
jgi:hypothetical protein